MKTMAVRRQPGASVLRANPTRERNRLPINGAVLPRLPLGGDDEFVVKVAGEKLEEAEITWEPVSRLFHYAPCCVFRTELKALHG